MVRDQVQFVLRFGSFNEFRGLLGQLLTIEQRHVVAPRNGQRLVMPTPPCPAMVRNTLRNEALRRSVPRP
jgi:hypothetical protein